MCVSSAWGVFQNFLGVFERFCLFVTENLISRFPVLQPKIAIQVNSSTLMFPEKSSIF